MLVSFHPYTYTHISLLFIPFLSLLNRFFSNSMLSKKPGLTLDMIDNIPGRLTDRRTPLGELNWIFTAITDTIAWNMLPRSKYLLRILQHPIVHLIYIPFKSSFYFFSLLSLDLFQKLFRQDLLVASLFRNFLLAERIMRSLNCTPISYPRLPPTFQHPMWYASSLLLLLLPLL